MLLLVFGGEDGSKVHNLELACHSVIGKLLDVVGHKQSQEDSSSKCVAGLHWASFSFLFAMATGKQVMLAQKVKLLLYWSCCR